MKFASHNPATGEVVWQGEAADAAAVDAAVSKARETFKSWGFLPFEERKTHVEAFGRVVERRKDELAEAIARETGKPLWDSASEVVAMIGKIAISIQAYRERTGEKHVTNAGVTTAVRHRPHGVAAVFGPYNFPAHLPNGHIVPALLAGNTVVLKPSELTPGVAELMVDCWHEEDLPDGVVNLVQGERETGKALASHPGIDALYFTGSSDTGHILSKQFADTPHKILALEMGGNNPLVVWDAANIDAVVYYTIQSAYMTAGQRCSCARRLILPEKDADKIIEALLAKIPSIQIGAYTDTPEPYMGPLVSNKEAEKILAAQDVLKKLGGKILAEVKRPQANLPFLTPGLVEVTGVQGVADREYFGPLLQVYRVKDFDAAIREANNTRFGLTAALLSDDKTKFDRFIRETHAGIINWNRQTTGASSAAPYGGLGLSGNHRPAAYYAADYCAYPVASTEMDKLTVPVAKTPGLTF